MPNYADINGRPMKKLQIQQYLRKLQLNDFEPAVNLATLTKLQDAHLKYIPYENFDCLNGKIKDRFPIHLHIGIRLIRLI